MRDFYVNVDPTQILHGVCIKNPDKMKADHECYFHHLKESYSNFECEPYEYFVWPKLPKDQEVDKKAIKKKSVTNLRFLQDKNIIIRKVEEPKQEEEEEI